MSNKILFSTLGFTDPTRDNYDGAYLHILRKMKPKKVYLVMTKEICEFDEKDDRYEEMGKRVAKKEGFLCEFEKIRYAEKDSPHKFDQFRKDFEDLLRKIRNEYKECEILVNLSSGTPQMKETLHLICATSMLRLTPIQVESPSKRANRSRSSADTYDIESEWENLLDNCDELATNRIIPIEVDNVLEIFIKEKIKGYLDVYDYSGAIMLANETKDLISERTMYLLKGAESRLGLKEEYKEYFRKADYKPKVVDYSAAIKVCEYILSIDVKVKKKQYMDFIRAISPVLTDLFLDYLIVVCKVDIYKFYKKDRFGIYKINSAAISSCELKQIFINEFGEIREVPMAASNLLLFITHYSKDEEVKNIADKLRKVEENIRNRLAHEIVGINDYDIKNKVELNCSDIINLIKRLFTIIYKDYCKKGLWDSYNELNLEIKNCL